MVEGLLICGKRADGTEGFIKMLKSVGIRVWEWDYLLRTAETLHQEFLEVVKDRAKAKSPDDPRIKALEKSDDKKNEMSDINDMFFQGLKEKTYELFEL